MTVDPIYKGEAVLRSRGENDKGRWVRLEIDAEFGTAHPFFGLEGERFAVVIVGPLASTDHGQTKQIAGRKTGKAGVLSAREDERGSGIASSPGAITPATTPATKPKQRWEDMRPSARAAMLTKNPEFWAWACMAEPRDYPKTGLNETNTDTWLKNRLGITSKSEMDTAGAQSSMLFYFDEITGNFRAYQQAKGHHVI